MAEKEQKNECSCAIYSQEDVEYMQKAMSDLLEGKMTVNCTDDPNDTGDFVHTELLEEARHMARNVL